MGEHLNISIDADKVLRGLARARQREIRAGQRTGITKATRLGRAETMKNVPAGVPRQAVRSRVRTRRGVITGTVWAVWPYRLAITGTRERYTRGGAYRGRIAGTDAFAHAAARVDPIVGAIVEREMKIRLERSGLSVGKGIGGFDL